jgi:hypothetical protein
VTGGRAPGGLGLVVVAAALSTLSCERRPEPAPEGPPPMSVPEKDRAVTICERYVARVCGCAERDATLRDTCELSRGQPEAVRMHLDVLAGAPLAEIGPGGQVRDAGSGRRGPLNDGERRLTESSLRKVVAACVKLDADLDPARCPRPRGSRPGDSFPAIGE